MPTTGHLGADQVLGGAACLFAGRLLLPAVRVDSQVWGSGSWRGLVIVGAIAVEEHVDPYEHHRRHNPDEGAHLCHPVGRFSKGHMVTRVTISLG